MYFNITDQFSNQSEIKNLYHHRHFRIFTRIRRMWARKFFNFSIKSLPDLWEPIASRYIFPMGLKRITFEMNVITFEKRNDNVAAAATYSLAQI